jgi:predicted GNAT family acetyltransferase
MEPKAPYKTRYAGEADIAFIFSSWLRSYRETRAVKILDNATYYEGQHATIEGIMARPDIIVEVACDIEDPSQIFGYVVYQPGVDGVVIHWTYVKLPFRGFGIGSDLVKNACKESPGKLIATHLPKLEKKLFEHNHVTYNPYLAVFNYE